MGLAPYGRLNTFEFEMFQIRNKIFERPLDLSLCVISKIGIMLKVFLEMIVT